MQEITLNVLNVGQGLCSVVSGIKDDGEPYCGIFDCGTLAYNPQCSKEALLAQIDELICIDGEKVITDIVISHQDIDHWSLLIDILSRYFDMPKDCLSHKDKFLYKMEKDGTRLYKISKIINYIARFKGVFEGENSMQKIDYALRDDDLVSNFYYEGIFYENGSRWEIRVSISKPLMVAGLRLLNASLICKSDTGEVLAKANCGDTVPVMEIEECSGLMFEILRCAVEEKLTADRLEESNFIYLEDYIEAACELVQNDQHPFLEIAQKLASVPDNGLVNPIERFVWGGAEPGPKCKLEQEIISLMNDYGYINQYTQYPDGGYVKFENDQMVETNAMICDNYDSDMVDAHEETIQQLNIKKNATSVVACMNIADQVRFLFPGDITVHRFDMLAEAVEDGKAYEVSLMMAPHHGSDVTNFCILQDTLHIQPIHLLLNLFRNDAIRIFIVSALSSMFGHPGKDFFVYAAGSASNGPEHEVCYVEEKMGKKRAKFLRKTEIITENVFCTEMTGDFEFSYPDFLNAAGFERIQAPRGQCKAPSKRLFI